MRLSVVILAAGQGKRMFSDYPKVLHGIGGKPLLLHVLETADGLGAERCFVVYGHGGETVKDGFAGQPGIVWVEQAQQLGTGHAVEQVLPHVADGETVLVLYGDVPLIQAETLQPLLATAERDGLGLLTAELVDPTGYGRIVRDEGGRVVSIVEEKDAGAEVKSIREVNTGILAAPVGRLRRWIKALDNHNAQGEYYLTDIIAMAVEDGLVVEAFPALDPQEVQGVNDRLQLAVLERYYQRRRAEALLKQGATLLDPERLDVRGDVIVGKDVTIDVNVVFEGNVRLGNRVRIGPHSVIRDTVLDDDTEVLSHCCIDGAVVGKGVQIGPFARVRPGTQLIDEVKLGNFVEIKKAVVGRKSKVNHLTYIGDAEIGEDVNVGAGTITCNYDGANKHKTVIGDRAFIGSNTALVAPVHIGEEATVGAGSAINKNLPARSLGLSRAPQRVIEGWQRPGKKR